MIDEIENGLHYTVQEELFTALLSLAENLDVQIVATTHSEECTRAAYKALKDRGDQFAYYRLVQAEDTVKAVHLDQEMVGTAINFNMEIR